MGAHRPFTAPRFWETETAFKLETDVIVPVSQAAHEILINVPVFDPAWEAVDPSGLCDFGQSNTRRLV